MEKGYIIDNIFRITKLNTFFQRQYPNGYSFKGEYHNFYEVVCVLSGEVLVTAGKDVYTLKAGEITYHPPEEFHAFREEANSHPNIIIFSFEAENFPDVKGKIFQLTEHNISEIKEIYNVLLKVFEFEPPTKYGKRIWVQEINDGEEASVALFIKKLELFLLSILNKDTVNEESMMKTRGSRSFYKILTVMEENISNSLHVEAIAKLCGISVPTLEKTIYHFLGYGAMAHYNILKMQKAYKMLLDGFSVKEVAFYLGFSNQNYFSARFKKYYGFPPSTLGRS